MLLDICDMSSCSVDRKVQDMVTLKVFFNHRLIKSCLNRRINSNTNNWTILDRFELPVIGDRQLSDFKLDIRVYNGDVMNEYLLSNEKLIGGVVIKGDQLVRLVHPPKPAVTTAKKKVQDKAFAFDLTQDFVSSVSYGSIEIRGRPFLNNELYRINEDKLTAEIVRRNEIAKNLSLYTMIHSSVLSEVQGYISDVIQLRIVSLTGIRKPIVDRKK